jgi:hypothetical protein
MKKYKIEQEKQKNEIWGVPTLCYSIDRFILLDDRKHLLFSATLALLSQIWNRPFKIFNSTVNGFSIEIGGGRIVGFRYDRYEINDDILYEFETDKEHVSYLRKHKLEKLNERINI